MAIQGSIELDDAELLSALDRLYRFVEPDTEAAQEVLQEVERNIEALLQAGVFQYPPQSNEPMADLWTDKQRRYFFAALADGRIQVPYRRTNRLRNSLQVRIADVLRGYDALLEVGIPDDSPAGSYARYVVGDNTQQSQYFQERTFWVALDTEFTQQQARINQAVIVAFETVLDRLRL